MKLKLADIARIVGGEIVAPEGAEEIAISGVAKIERAGPGEITFVAAPRYERFLQSTRAAAVIVSPGLAREQLEGEGGCRSALLRAEDPYRAFMKVMETFSSSVEGLPPGVHPTAIVPASASVHPEARVGAYVVLGERVSIGAGTRIWHHVVLGMGVAVGADCVLYPGVVIREGCEIGDRVILHSGTVVGADGFGYLPMPDGRREKVPQMGSVALEDDVEIGANTTIDRAMVDRTTIRRGAKIDNLVQIAHNVEVGEDTCIAALSGISGSSKIGARNLLAGQVGVADQASTCDDVILLARGAVRGEITSPGIYRGSPCKDRMTQNRIEAATNRLPDLLRRVRDLETKLAALDRRGRDPELPESP